MNKVVFAIVYVILLVMCALFGFRYLYNAYAVNSYNQGNYAVSLEPLENFNLFEKYVLPYNQGNIHYMKGEYIEAVRAYDMALSKNPPEKKECDIRVNKALAMLKTVEADYLNPDASNIEHTKEVLRQAREVLLEVGCASDDGNGHDEDAQTLKEEIDKMLEEMEQQSQEQSEEEQEDQNQSSGDADQEEQQQQNSEQSAEDTYENDVEQEMEERMEQSAQERQEEEAMNGNEDYTYYDLDGKVW